MSADWEKRARVAEENYAALLERWREEQRRRLGAEAEVERLRATLHAHCPTCCCRLGQPHE